VILTLVRIATYGGLQLEPFSNRFDSLYSPTVSLKTLHLSGPLDASLGGPPEALAGLVSALDHEGVDVSVIAVGTERSESPALLKILRDAKVALLLPASGLGARWQFSRRSAISIMKMSRESDVIVCHGFYTFSVLAAIWLAPFHKKPIVVMPHGSLEPYQELMHPRRKRIFRALIRNGKRIDLIAVASQQEVQTVSQNPWITSEIVFAGLGVDTSPTPHGSAPFGHLARKEPYVLFIGRIAEKKRVDLCIEAIKILSEKGNPINLIIAGDGNETLKNTMRLLTERYALTDLVHFVGHIEGNEKWKTISNASVVILPSENENFAVAIAESLSAGTPVVVSQFVALSRVVSEYGAGVVINDLRSDILADAILEVLDKRVSMSESALKAADEISWKRVGENWIDILESVIKVRNRV
jgi:glycosyltransferase involved in cell wall biosynthesis